MTADAIMTREVVTVPPDTTLSDIRSRLYEGGFRHLLVIDDDRLVGVICDRDLLRAFGPYLNASIPDGQEGNVLARPAHDIMREDPITITASTDVEEAASLVLEHKISSLPVVNGEEILGLVTTQDLLRHYTESR